MQHNRDSFILRGTGRISTILKTDLSKYTHCVVKTVSIPKTYYTLPSDANLILNEGSGDIQVGFTAGNYNVNSFRLLLQTNLNAAGTYTYAVSFPNARTDVDTGHYTITVSNNTSSITISTDDIYLAQMMGIDPNTTYTSVGNKIESVNVVNFQSYDEIIIRSNIVTSKDQILQEVYSSGTLYNTSIEWEASDILLHQKKLSIGLGVQHTLEFFLTDSNGNEIDLNGNAWSLSIMFFREDNIIPLLKRWMRLQLLQQQ